MTWGRGDSDSPTTESEPDIWSTNLAAWTVQAVLVRVKGPKKSARLFHLKLCMEQNYDILF